MYYNYSNSWYKTIMEETATVFNKIKQKYSFSEKEQNLLNYIHLMIMSYKLTASNVECLEIAVKSLRRRIMGGDPDFDLLQIKIEALKNALYGFV